MGKKRKIVVGAIIAAIAMLAAASVLLFASTREKGEWVAYDSYRPPGKPFSDLGQFLVWEQDVNQANVFYVPFYQYKLRKEVESPVRICIMRKKEIVSFVDARVWHQIPGSQPETEPIVFTGNPSLNGKRIAWKLFLYVPPSTKEDIEKRVKMTPKVFTKGGKPL